MTSEQIADLVRHHIDGVGLVITRIEVNVADPDLMPTIPTVEVYVLLDGLDPDEVYRRMHQANKTMCHSFGAGIDPGYYSAAIGYEDIPTDQAMLEFNGLPFDLDLQPAPAPR